MKRILSSLILISGLTASVNGAVWHEWEASTGGNGHYYTVVGENPGEIQNWYDAQIEAANLGGYLVTIQSAAELSFVRSTFGRTELFWTGLTSPGGQGGSFTWDNGQAITYSNLGSSALDPGVFSSVVINQVQQRGGRAFTKGFVGAVDPFSEYRGIVEYDSGIPGSQPPTTVPDGGSPLALIAISGVAGMVCRFLKK
jgi:hypothetical protein